MKVDIEKQFGLYLKMVGLKKEEMHPIQLQETKRAFFGAWGQLLALMKDDVSALPDEEAVKVLQDMLNQVFNFWNSQN